MNQLFLFYVQNLFLHINQNLICVNNAKINSDSSILIIHRLIYNFNLKLKTD